tara:strand:- start:1378 stop:1863 length:486 start_codon:yes stop_codon:yes gene_type:complete
MAIKDPSRKPYLIDNDSNVKVGINLPFTVNSEGSGAVSSTSTTIEAVKNNIRNLLQTNPGERLMQPNLGVELRSIIFETIDEATLIAIQDIILDSVEYWLPFVEVQDIQLLQDARATDSNKVIVKIIFNIKQDPNTTDSVSVDFNSGISSDISTDVGGGGY